MLLARMPAPLRPPIRPKPRVYAGAAFSVRSRCTRAWARGAEGWRIVGGQVGNIPEGAN